MDNMVFVLRQLDPIVSSIVVAQTATLAHSLILWDRLKKVIVRVAQQDIFPTLVAQPVQYAPKENLQPITPKTLVVVRLFKYSVVPSLAMIVQLFFFRLPPQLLYAKHVDLVILVQWELQIVPFALQALVPAMRLVFVQIVKQVRILQTPDQGRVLIALVIIFHFKAQSNVTSA
jgi:hypothetical protein